MNPRRLQIFAWSLSITVTVIAVIAWGQSNSWQLSGLSTYQIFPLLGLLAFSIMWSHYVAAVLRLYYKYDKGLLSRYFEVTSLVVLASILLHPGLLGWQLWRDGLGLPPANELHYVAPDMRLYIIIAMISYVIFLAYEFRRKFGARTWWKYIAYASDTAMILIFIHSLKLGSQLQMGWFRAVWYLYGLTLLGCLAYIYSQKAKLKKANQA
ncbi:MAG TPA: hypothetical protein VM124_00345 [Candidatus Limnocylindrales bacterium]|nr:hypothetical protein [Candidatus Limnocylindrales bacterium]